jgi:hypothetical protein
MTNGDFNPVLIWSSAFLPLIAQMMRLVEYQRAHTGGIEPRDQRAQLAVLFEVSERLVSLRRSTIAAARGLVEIHFGGSASFQKESRNLRIH